MDRFTMEVGSPIEQHTSDDAKPEELSGSLKDARLIDVERVVHRLVALPRVVHGTLRRQQLPTQMTQIERGKQCQMRAARTSSLAGSRRWQL